MQACAFKNHFYIMIDFSSVSKKFFLLRYNLHIIDCI